MKYIYQYKIVQLTDHQDYSFMDYEYAKKHGFRFSDYHVEYEGNIEATNIYEALDKLYEIFNIHRPDDFKGHSLSVSDIIEIDGYACYCNPVGWEIGI